MSCYRIEDATTSFRRRRKRPISDSSSSSPLSRAVADVSVPARIVENAVVTTRAPTISTMTGLITAAMFLLLFLLSGHPTLASNIDSAVGGEGDGDRVGYNNIHNVQRRDDATRHQTPDVTPASEEISVTLQPEGEGENRWVATVRFTTPPIPPSGQQEDINLSYESCTEIIDGQYESEEGASTTTDKPGGAGRQRRRRICIRGHIESVVHVDSKAEPSNGLAPTSTLLEERAKASTASASSQQVIRVGDKVYQPPFDAYGSEALRRHFMAHPGFVDGSTGGSRGVDPADEADWLIELGFLYQSSLHDEDQQPNPDPTIGTSDGPRRRVAGAAAAAGSGVRRAAVGGVNNIYRASQSMHSVSVREQHMEHSINAYKQAVRILQGIVRSGASWKRQHNDLDAIDDRDEYIMDARFLLAHTYFAMSDAYAGISWSDYGGHEDDEDGTTHDSSQHRSPSHHPLAVSYMKLAEKSYRQILASPAGALDGASVRTAQTARAVCCVRLGVLMLEDPLLDAALAKVGTADKEETMADLTRQYYQAMADQGELAMGYFREAANYYQEHTRIGTKDSSDAPTADSTTSAALEFDYATVLHNMATASTYRGRDHEMTAEYARQAIEHYQAVLDRSRHRDVSLDADNDFGIAAVPSAVGELLLLVSDSYMKLGRYEDSKAYYAKCMAWYERHDLPAPPASTGMMAGLEGASGGDGDAISGAIEDYEKALDEYKTLLQEQSNVQPEGAEDGGMYPVEAQDGYEGDLHMNLGSLYMANGDVYTAISHLQQASLLYERSDEKEDVANVADVKFTLAALHFRHGDYKASIQLHVQALDMYSRYGGGAVPMDEGIPQVQPTVTFMLDPIESDTEVELGQARAEFHEPERPDEHAASEQLAQRSTSSNTNQKVDGSTGGSNRAGKVDPVLAMMDYWYAALANDTDDAAADPGKPDDANRAQETGKDEL